MLAYLLVAMRIMIAHMRIVYAAENQKTPKTMKAQPKQHEVVAEKMRDDVLIRQPMPCGTRVYPGALRQTCSV